MLYDLGRIPGGQITGVVGNKFSACGIDVLTTKQLAILEKHRCLVEKNVPIVLILPSRWQYGAVSLGIECTSCLCLQAVVA